VTGLEVGASTLAFTSSRHRVALSCEYGGVSKRGKITRKDGSHRPSSSWTPLLTMSYWSQFSVTIQIERK
jgi:hypothetical protein